MTWDQVLRFVMPGVGAAFIAVYGWWASKHI